MAMLNHLSRTGCDRKPRSAMPKPAQVDTLGMFTEAKATPIMITDRKGERGSVYIAIAVTAITQAFGLTHWNTAASKNVIGRAVPSRSLPIERDIAIL